jgi:hypothetical protein
MPPPDDDSSDDDEEDIFARPDDAVEAVWSDDDDENETRGLATSDECERRDDVRGTPTGTRVAFERDDDREDDGDDVVRDRHVVGDAGRASTSAGGADDDETTAKRRRGAAAPAPNRDAEPLEEEDREEEDGCESMAIVRSRMLLADFDTLARPPEPTYRPAAPTATTVDDDSESEDDVREYGDDDHQDDDDDVDAIGAGVDVGNRINVVFQAPNGERFTRSVGERETFARVVEAWRDGYEWAEVALALGSDKVRIVFEGDAVRGDETPEALGLEEDDMLELLPG